MAHGRVITAATAKATAATATAMDPARPIESLEDVDARPEVEPVIEQVELAVEDRGEADIQGFHDGQKAESTPTTTAVALLRRGGDTRTTATMMSPARGRQMNATGVIRLSRVGTARTNQMIRPAITASAAALDTSGCWSVSVAPQPPDLPTERFTEQGERGEKNDAHDEPGEKIRRGNRQRNALDGRDDLGPKPRRGRGPQPREKQARCDERVPGETDRQHPGADGRGDIQAQHQDEERVDLHVEARTKRRHGARAPGHPTIDSVEHQRHRGQRHEHGDRSRPIDRVGDQRGDTADQAGSGERDPIGGTESPGTPPDDRSAQQRVRDHGVENAGAPAGGTEAQGRREHGEQPELGNQPDDRAR